MSAFDELKARAEAAESALADALEGLKDQPEPAAAEPAPTLDGDTIIAEAKAKLHAGEGLGGLHVRALEHPEEFAGLQVTSPDTGIAPTA